MASITDKNVFIIIMRNGCYNKREDLDVFFGKSAELKDKFNIETEQELKDFCSENGYNYQFKATSRQNPYDPYMSSNDHIVWYDTPWHSGY